MNFFPKKTVARESATIQPATSLEERREVLAQIERERAQHAEGARRIAARRAAADDQLAHARTLLRDAEVQSAELQVEEMAASGNHAVAVQRLEARLRVGASSLIDSFLREIEEQVDVARSRGVLQIAERLGREVSGERVPGGFVSNSESVNRRIGALRHAAVVAEAMKLEAIDEAELRARLEKIRDEIPAIEGLLVDQPPLLTRGEQRVVAWAHGASA
jgi:hypothetical protein